MQDRALKVLLAERGLRSATKPSVYDAAGQAHSSRPSCARRRQRNAPGRGMRTLALSGEPQPGNVAALREEKPMPVYVMLLKYTEQGFRGIKTAPARLEQT